MQNEMLQVLALGIIKEISSSILEAKFYTVMADKSADVSNEEQMSPSVGLMTILSHMKTLHH